MEATLIASLLKLGAPWVMTAILLVLFWSERKEKNTLAKELLKTTISLTTVFTEFKGAVLDMKKDVEEIEKRIR